MGEKQQTLSPLLPTRSSPVAVTPESEYNPDNTVSVELPGSPQQDSKYTLSLPPLPTNTATPRAVFAYSQVPLSAAPKVDDSIPGRAYDDVLLPPRALGDSAVAAAAAASPSELVGKSGWLPSLPPADSSLTPLLTSGSASSLTERLRRQLRPVRVALRQASKERQQQQQQQ